MFWIFSARIHALLQSAQHFGRCRFNERENKLFFSKKHKTHIEFVDTNEKRSEKKNAIRKLKLKLCVQKINGCITLKICMSKEQCNCDEPHKIDILYDVHYIIDISPLSKSRSPTKRVNLLMCMSLWFNNSRTNPLSQHTSVETWKIKVMKSEKNETTKRMDFWIKNVITRRFVVAASVCFVFLLVTCFNWNCILFLMN